MAEDGEVTKKSGSEDNVIVYLDRGTVRTIDERNRRQMSDWLVTVVRYIDIICLSFKRFNTCLMFTLGHHNSHIRVSYTLA